MALWAPLSKTKALCQTGPCSHVSSCLTSKEWLVTNMQGRICSRYSKSQQTITCFFVFRGREKIAQVLSREAVRLLSAPLDGAAESRPRCASLCWSPSSASTLLLLLWQQLAHIITHTAINVLAQTKPSSLCVSHKIASPPSRQRETTVIYTQLKYCVFYLFIWNKVIWTYINRTLITCNLFCEAIRCFICLTFDLHTILHQVHFESCSHHFTLMKI